MKFNLGAVLSRPSAVPAGREILDLLIEAVYLATVFLIPLWFAYFLPTYNIFDFNKLIVFKILVWFLFLLTALKLIFFSSRGGFSFGQFFKKYWLWPSVFIAGLSLSLIFSDNPLLSFYGTMERQAGLVSYLFYFFWFILLSFNILTISNHRPRTADTIKKRIRRVVVTAVIAASLVSFYGLLQILNLDFLTWPESAFITHRVFSTIGQPNFLASWLLLVIPLSLYLGISAPRFLLKFFYFLALALQLICLVLTGSRGGLAALLLTAALYVLYLLFNAAWSRRHKFLLGAGFVCCLIISLAAANHIWPGRISDLVDYQSGSVGARANFYTAAADAIKTRPVFGYGLESGEEIFIKYYEPDWAVYGDVGQSADRAHNLVLDILLSVGFYGLILFVILYYFFWKLFKNNLRRNHQPALSLALAGGAAAYLFSLLFSFTVVAGEIYFWLFLALLVAINYEAGGSPKKENLNISAVAGTNSRKIWLLVKVALALALSVLVVWRVAAAGRSLAADYYFNEIYYTLAKSEYFTALVLDSYLQEQKPNPINREFYDYFWGDKISEFYPSIAELVPKQAVARKLTEVEKSLPDTSYKNLLAKAKINDVLGHYQLAQLYLDRVIAITPHWPLVYMEQGKLAANEHDSKTAIVAYNLALLNLPAESDSRLNDQHRALIQKYKYFIYYRLGNIYESDQDYAAAAKYFQLAYRSDSSDLALLKKIADTFYHRGNLVKAREYTRRGLARNPQDYKWSVALASLYYESGDKVSALEYLDQALALAPDNQELLGLKKTYGQ